MTIEQRLDRLERQNRLMKGSASVLLLGLLTIATLGASQQNSIPDLIEARAFHVVGKDGAALVKIDTWKIGDSHIGAFSTYGANQKLVVGIGATDGGHGLVATWDGRGQQLVKLGVTTEGEGTVTTRNGLGKELVKLGVGLNGNGTLTTKNRLGGMLVRLGSTQGGAGAVSVLNGSGVQIAEIGMSTEGVGLMSVFDPSGRLGSGRLAPGL